jgi:hypothetical protein
MANMSRLARPETAWPDPSLRLLSSWRTSGLFRRTPARHSHDYPGPTDGHTDRSSAPLSLRLPQLFVNLTKYIVFCRIYLCALLLIPAAI